MQYQMVILKMIRMIRILNSYINSRGKAGILNHIKNYVIVG